MTRAIMLVLIGGLAAGCLYVPYPIGPVEGSRRPPGDESLEILKNAPTREEVLLALGEPDWVGEGQRLFVYAWRRDWGYLAVAYRGGGTITGRRHILVVEFDGRGIVRRSEVRRSFLTNDVGELVEGW